MRGIGTKIKESKKEYDFETKILIVILILTEYGLYLIDTEIFSFGMFKYSDICLFSYIFFGFYVLKKYNKYPNPKYKFKFVSLFTIVLVIVSSIRTWSLFGQSISQGISPQRQFVISYLMYFVMARYFSADKNNFYKFEKAVYLVGPCQLILYIMQYLLVNVKLFLYITPDVRFGDTRLMFSANLPNFFMAIIVNNLLRGKEVKKNIFYLLLYLVYVVVVCKTRIVVLALGLTLVIVFMLWRKNLLIKSACFFIVIGLSIIILSLPFMNNYLSLLDSKVRTSDPTYVVRQRGKDFYKGEISKSPLLGRGFPNIKNDKVNDVLLIRKGYFLIDNGLIGFIYMYGMIGAAWFAILVIQMMIASLKLYIRRNDYSMLAYVIFCLTVISNIMTFYWTTFAIYIAIALGILENTSKDNT